MQAKDSNSPEMAFSSSATLQRRRFSVAVVFELIARNGRKHVTLGCDAVFAQPCVWPERAPGRCVMKEKKENESAAIMPLNQARKAREICLQHYCLRCSQYRRIFLSSIQAIAGHVQIGVAMIRQVFAIGKLWVTMD